MIWCMVPNRLHLCNKPAPKVLSTRPMGWVCSSNRQPAALLFGLANAPQPLQYAKHSELNYKPLHPAHHEIRQTTLAQMEPPPMDTQSVSGAGSLFFALSAELYGANFVVSIL